MSPEPSSDWRSFRGARHDIKDYGYRLLRAWRLGDAQRNDGVILLLSTNPRKVRIEVGYGLEPVLTDALSSVILQTRFVPKLKRGDVAGGLVDGAEAIMAATGGPSQPVAELLAARVPVALAAPSPVHRKLTPDEIGTIRAVGMTFGGFILFFVLVFLLGFILRRRGVRLADGGGGASFAEPSTSSSPSSSSSDSGFTSGGGSAGGGGADASW